MKASREQRTRILNAAVATAKYTETDYKFYFQKDEWSDIEVMLLFAQENTDQLWELIQASLNTPGKLTYSRCELRSTYGGGENKYWFDPFTIIHWAIGKEIPIPDILIEWHDKQLKLSEEKPLNETEADAPVPAYYSDHLKILIQASGYFWANAEKSEKDTHPKNEKVVAWLVEKGFSAISAKQGATIIRPKWAAKGNY